MEEETKNKLTNTQENEPKKSFWTSLAFTGWGLSKEELREEVEKYDTLPLGKSSRKTAAAVWGFFVVLGLIVAFFFRPSIDTRLDIAIGLIFIPFIYKGFRLALILAAVFWVFEKSYNVWLAISGERINFLSLFFIFVSTVIVLKTLYAAFVVEQERKKLKKIYLKNLNKMLMDQQLPKTPENSEWAEIFLLVWGCIGILTGIFIVNYFDVGLLASIIGPVIFLIFLFSYSNIIKRFAPDRYLFLLRTPKENWSKEDKIYVDKVANRIVVALKYCVFCGIIIIIILLLLIKRIFPNPHLW